jgi:hypothetical protein
MGIAAEKSTIPYLFICWVSAIVMTYSLLFFIGKIIFHEWEVAAYLGIGSLAGFIGMRLAMKPAGLLKQE